MVPRQISYSPFRTWIRARNYARAMRGNQLTSDLFVVSFPKCGRTWHRVLLGRYLTGMAGLDARSAMNLKDLCVKNGLRRVCYTHNGTSPTHYLPAEHRLVANPLEWSGKDIIVLVRDPRDTMVSAYHHMAHREQAFEGSISDFIRFPPMGIARLATAWDRWNENRRLARSFAVQSYEEMHQDPASVLKATLSAIGVAQIDETLLQEAVQFASFDNMKQLEKVNYFNSVALQNGSGDERGLKVRQGKIGGYKNSLSAEDIQFIESAIRAIGDPFATLRATNG